MFHKIMLMTLTLCAASSMQAMQFQENQQLREAILRLDHESVRNILNQRNDLLPEDEYWHYINVLNQRPTIIGSFEFISLVKYALGPIITGVLAAYGAAAYSIAPNLKECVHPSTALQWIKYGVGNFLHYSSRVSLGLAGVAGATTLGAYVLSEYALDINSKRHSIGAVLQQRRALNREPVRAIYEDEQ